MNTDLYYRSSFYSFREFSDKDQFPSYHASGDLLIPYLEKVYSKNAPVIRTGDVSDSYSPKSSSLRIEKFLCAILKVVFFVPAALPALPDTMMVAFPGFLLLT